ncbi:MAG: hypothetical protein A3J28_01915 [Acidobacteria bacterium RIFCSPLOWO2_12_FULL_60_22]|nr:MAG: hypothetical protein A3J28_01915 [Acidobacteria bacterium RIFCSPLOWO2_12_FULL_60_22]
MPLRTITLILALFCISASLWAADDPMIGNWKLNGAKSKFGSGPPRKSETRRHEPYGKDGLKVTNDRVNEQGAPLHITYTAEYDGKDYPVTGDPSRDTVSMKRIDAYTVEGTSKKAGKVTVIFRHVVSKDGKTLTITQRGANAPGPPTNAFVIVFDKQ